jgi:hypothetical protein
MVLGVCLATRFLPNSPRTRLIQPDPSLIFAPPIWLGRFPISRIAGPAPICCFGRQSGRRNSPRALLSRRSTSEFFGVIRPVRRDASRGD